MSVARRPLGRGAVVLLVLAGFLAAVLVAGLGLGALAIPPGRVLAILAAPLGLELPWSYTAREAAVLWHIRLPRVLFGALAGAGLAGAGALMQALFRNPLADPGLLGVASGGTVAAALVTLFGGAGLATLSSAMVLPGAAFLGSIAVTLLVFRLARLCGQTRVEHLLLAGIALNALAGAALGLLMLVADDAQMRELAFWSMGSLGRASWPAVAAMAILLAPLLVRAPRLAPALNALLLGEAEASHLGVRVETLKRAAVILCCLAVGGAVAFAGLIGFVGLVVPHLVRLLWGPDHRLLLPAALLLGASLLPLADVLARCATAPVELPIGLVTALVGAPFFLVLLLRDLRREAA